MDGVAPSLSSSSGGSGKNKVMMGVLFFVVVALVASWWFFVYKKRKNSVEVDTSSSTSGGEEVPIIYGSLGCPYTIKQMEKYKNHKFVDCTSDKCPEFVTAYPTTKFSDGKIEVGFS